MASANVVGTRPIDPPPNGSGPPADRRRDVSDPSAEYDYAQTRYRANATPPTATDTLVAAGANVQQKIKRAVSDGLNSIDLLVMNATGNDVKTFYPFAMLIMSLIPVLILLCQRLVNCMTKFVVVIIYALMLVLTFCMFRK